MEWFEQLEAKDPSQAQLVRKILAQVGTLQACTLCGGQPAIDYARENAAQTLKLCADCLARQQTLFKSTFFRFGG
jgi:RNA polymerase-binding transcription factor DksA